MIVPYVLPCIFFIVDKMEPHEFLKRMLPSLKPVFSIKDPTQCVILLLDNMELILKKCSKDVIRDGESPAGWTTDVYDLGRNCTAPTRRP